MNNDGKYIPHIQDCIKYIESCGWDFLYYNRPWYAFGNGKKTITFTLTEIREAFKFGW